MTATAPRHRTIVEVNTALRCLGYTAGYPVGMAAEARRRDEADAAAASCPACGCPGLSLHPYHRGERYEAIACCHECGTAAVLV